MRICHIISSIDRKSGGTSTYIKLLSDFLIRINGNDVCVVTKKSREPLKLDVKINLQLIDYNFLHFLFFKRCCNLFSILDCDLFHSNGLWDPFIHKMVSLTIRKKVPLIISPHGMLESWSLSQGKLKKKIALWLFQYKDLKNASCIHATAPMEVESIRKLGLKNPIAMIPNGIQLEEFSMIPPEKSIVKKKILFLSRIHVKKGIENLIDAWLLIDDDLRNDWCIDIIGNGEVSYIESLRLKIKKCELEDQIFIKAPVFGKDKIDIFREANLFVLPTYSENFGIVIAEALASYTPVITTKGTPWKDLEDYNCGWWIDIGVTPLKNALVEALKRDQQDLNEMGSNGRKLIEKRYSMQSVAKQMVELYNWVLKTGPKPKFVDVL